jgi:hypothetical protein
MSAATSGAAAKAIRGAAKLSLPKTARPKGAAKARAAKPAAALPARAGGSQRLSEKA